jgi:hypothetical protein
MSLGNIHSEECKITVILAVMRVKAATTNYRDSKMGKSLGLILVSCAALPFCFVSTGEFEF